MYLRIDGPHEDALERLGEMYGERTGAAVVRQLIRQEAMRVGVWPTPAPGEMEADDEPEQREVIDVSA